jgi:spore coat polysaccharide biosynthesis protein SpsF
VKRVAAIIQARMTSRRLPGKHMMSVMGRPIIEYLINRLKNVPSIDNIVMATTVNDADYPLVELSKLNSIDFFRGSEPDVMTRVIESAKSIDAEIIVSITGDCPLIDPQLIEQAIQVFIHNDCDYLDNAVIPGYPGGMNVEIYTLKSLIKSSKLTIDPLDREHVSSHMLRNSDLFKPIFLLPSPELNYPELVLELDEKKDFVLLKKIIEHFGINNQLFSCKEIIDLLKKKPEWCNINKSVVRLGFE